jgi:hypothetical protein
VAVEIGNWNGSGAPPWLTSVSPRQAGGGVASLPSGAENSGGWTTLLGETTWVVGLRSIDGRIARAGQAAGMHIHGMLPVCPAVPVLPKAEGGGLSGHPVTLDAPPFAPSCLLL